MSDQIHLTATGDAVAVTKPASVFSVILTPAAALATAVIRTNGASGTIKATLQAPASGGSAVWTSGDSNNGVLYNKGVHVTITGAGALVDIEFEQGS